MKQELALKIMFNFRRYSLEILPAYIKSHQKSKINSQSKINSHQHILILLCRIIIIQIQLIAPDHHKMILLEHSYPELKVLNVHCIKEWNKLDN